jgi:hypothetical protein
LLYLEAFYGGGGESGGGKESGRDHLTVENALADAHHLLAPGQDGLHVLRWEKGTLKGQ